MRPAGTGRSDLLLNDGPPKVAARLIVGESGVVEAGARVADFDELEYVVNLM